MQSSNSVGHHVLRFWRRVSIEQIALRPRMPEAHRARVLPDVRAVAAVLPQLDIVPRAPAAIAKMRISSCWERRKLPMPRTILHPHRKVDHLAEGTRSSLHQERCRAPVDTQFDHRAWVELIGDSGAEPVERTLQPWLIEFARCLDELSVTAAADEALDRATIGRISEAHLRALALEQPGVRAASFASPQATR